MTEQLAYSNYTHESKKVKLFLYQCFRRFGKEDVLQTNALKPSKTTSFFKKICLEAPRQDAPIAIKPFSLGVQAGNFWEGGKTPPVSSHEPESRGLDGRQPVEFFPPKSRHICLDEAKNFPILIKLLKLAQKAFLASKAKYHHMIWLLKVAYLLL